MFTNEWETSAFQFRLYLRDVCIFVLVAERGLVIASIYIYIYIFIYIYIYI